MALRRREEKRRNPFEIVLYVLTGLAGVYVFLPVWDKVSWARVLILVLVVAALMALQAKRWRESRKSRKERRRRWGIRRGESGVADDQQEGGAGHDERHAADVGADHR